MPYEPTDEDVARVDHHLERIEQERTVDATSGATSRQWAQHWPDMGFDEEGQEPAFPQRPLATGGVVDLCFQERRVREAMLIRGEEVFIRPISPWTFTPPAAAATEEELHAAGRSWWFGGEGYPRTCPHCEADVEHLHRWGTGEDAHTERIPGTQEDSRSAIPPERRRLAGILARGLDIPLETIGLQELDGEILEAEPTPRQSWSAERAERQVRAAERVRQARERIQASDTLSGADQYGYDHRGIPIRPDAEEQCWADVWIGTSSHECGEGVDPNSALGLCTKHEADKQRFNEERSPTPPEPRPAVGLDELEHQYQQSERIFNPDTRCGGPFTALIGIGRPEVVVPLSGAQMAEAVQPIARAATIVMEAVQQIAEGAGRAIEQFSTDLMHAMGLQTPMERAIERGQFMDGAGWATLHQAGYRWRNPETREQWRVAGRPGNKHWIRTGPRRARYWK